MVVVVVVVVVLVVVVVVAVVVFFPSSGLACAMPESANKPSATTITFRIF